MRRGMRRGTKRSGDYFVCPHCGAEVSAEARACPECGSDDATGWAEDADRWAAGIPTGYSEDDEFDYEEFIRREFGRAPSRAFGLPLWLAVLLVAVLFTALVLALAGVLG